MKHVLFSTLIIFVASCTTSSNNQSVEVGNPAYQDSVNRATTITNNNAASKTDTEVITDAALSVVDEAVTAKRQSDSIKLLNKKSVWVYKIGLPKSSEEELWNMYDRVHGLGNIYAFRLSRKDYILIKNDFYSQQQVADSIARFNTLLNEIGVSETAQPFDLMSDCKLKETVVQSDNIKVKRKQEIPCFVCD